jgi:Gp37 protein
MTQEVQLDSPFYGETFTVPQATDLQTVQAGIIAYLRDMATKFGGPLSQVGIDNFPDKPEGYRLTHRVGEILVAFAEGVYDPIEGPQSVDVVSAQHHLSWDFHLAVRALGWDYGSVGAYGLITGLALALSGYQAPGFTLMRPVHERFSHRDESGVWYYEMRFTHSTVHVQIQPDVAYPTWLRTNWRERGGLTLVDVPVARYTFDAGGAVALGYGNVSNVVVTNPMDGQAWTEGEDYRVDAVNGLIFALSTGPLGIDSEVDIGFSHADLTVTLSPSAGGGPVPTAPTN